MQIEGFVNLIQTKILPNHIDSLKQCKNLDDLNHWKQSLIEQLNQNQVNEKCQQDILLIVPNPQDKEELSIPQKIYDVAQALDNDKRNIIEKQNEEKKVIQQQHLALEQAYGGFGPIQTQYQQLRKETNDKFIQETKLRDNEIAQVQTIAQVAADEAITILKEARAKISNPNNRIRPEKMIEPSNLTFNKYMLQFSVLGLLIMLFCLFITPQATLNTRLSQKIMQQSTLEQNFEYPRHEDLSYDNPIVGFFQSQQGWNGFNIIMKNESFSTLKEDSGKLTKVQIPRGEIIRKIVIHSDSEPEIRGIQFFDIDDQLLLEAGKSDSGVHTVINLADGERILGIKAKLRVPSPRLQDLQFVIGWLGPQDN